MAAATTAATATTTRKITKIIAIIHVVVLPPCHAPHSDKSNHHINYLYSLSVECVCVVVCGVCVCLSACRVTKLSYFQLFSAPHRFCFLLQFCCFFFWFSFSLSLPSGSCFISFSLASHRSIMIEVDRPYKWFNDT